MTRDGIRSIAVKKTGDGQRVIKWLRLLSPESAATVSAAGCSAPGTTTIEVVYPRLVILRDFLALPVDQQTVSAARARGIGVGYPGERHAAYPAIWVHGCNYRIVEDDNPAATRL